MKFASSFLFVVTFILAQYTVWCLAIDVIVKTSKGKVRGYLGGPKHNRINVFKGIPFAKPPAGKNRFRKPEPVTSWSGVLNASQYRPACITETYNSSNGQQKISEDCLYLNIFADPHCAVKKCAVVVYIHGGSFFFQSAVMFNESVIAEKFASHRIVFVIPAYRLGIFGFISVADEKFAPKNLGFYDMIAALEWVKNEISNFNGDPDRITLMGHSVGATAVQLLTLSETVPENLFQQGISMSHVDLYRRNLSNSMTMEIAYRVNCTKKGEIYETGALVECLRETPAQELLRHQNALTDVEYFDLMFGPEPDGYLFKADTAFKLLRQNKRPMLLGVTKNELALTRMRSTVPRECATYTGVFGYRTSEATKACIKRYSFKNGKLSVMKDETHSSALRMAMRLSSPSINKASPSVFLYSFEMPHHDSHSGDIGFLFDKDYYPRRKKMTDDELSMDKIYPTYIRMFVKTGQPSSDWKAFNSDQRNFMRITHVTYENGSIVEPQMQNAFYNNEAHLWLEQFASVERRALEINRSKQHSAKTFLADEIKADDIGEDSTDTPVLFWMGSFLITLVFVCLVITLTLLVLILYVRKFGYPSWLRNKVSDEHIEERRRILTAMNGKRYTIDESGLELKIF